MSDMQNKENVKERDTVDYLLGIVKKGFIFLLIAAILGGALGAVYVKVTDKSVYTGTIAFWVNNMSTNYDYTSTAQTAATTQIAQQLPELVVKNEPIRQAILEHNLVEKLGFSDETLSAFITGYNQALADVETAKTAVAEKSAVVESLNQRYEGTLQTAKELATETKQQSITDAKNVYDGVIADIDSATLTIQNFGDSLKAAHTAYINADESVRPAKQSELTAKIRELEGLVSSLNVSYASAVPEKDEVETNEDDTIVLTLDTSVYDLLVAYEAMLAEEKNAKNLSELQRVDYQIQVDEAEALYQTCKSDYDAAPTAEKMTAVNAAEAAWDEIKSLLDKKNKEINFAEGKIYILEKYLTLLSEAEKISGAVTLINHSNASYKEAEKVASSGAIVCNTLMLNVINGMGVRAVETYEADFTAKNSVADNLENQGYRKRDLDRATFDLAQAEAALNAARAKAGHDENDVVVSEENAAYLDRYEIAVEKTIRYIQKSLTSTLKEEGSFTFYVSAATDDREKTYAILSTLQNVFPLYVRDLLKLKVNENNTALVTPIDTVKSPASLTASTGKSTAKFALLGAIAGVIICFAVLWTLDVVKQKKQNDTTIENEEAATPANS